MDQEGSRSGSVTCTSWIRRAEKQNFVVICKSRRGKSPPLLEIFSYDSVTVSLKETPLVTYEFGEDDPMKIAVHPNGVEIVCSTNKGFSLFELHGGEDNAKLSYKDFSPLSHVGPQKCLGFSPDGSRFASGGEDGHFRIFEWPSRRLILDEPKAHKSFHDLDFSLDSEFVASTSVDGSARIWKADDGIPLTLLARKSDEKIECCRFSRDGTKPFLFCTVQKAGEVVIAVWDISTWNKLGYKRTMRKPSSALSISLDGKYLALGSKDGDMCVVEVKKMEVCHYSRKLHLGSSISSIEFCPNERVVISSSYQWGALVTKLNVPADWKEWQLYLVLLGLFLASVVVFYIFYENSDSFWKFPLGKDQPGSLKLKTFFKDARSVEEHNVW